MISAQTQHRRDFWQAFGDGLPELSARMVRGNEHSRWLTVGHRPLVIAHYVANGSVGLFVSLGIRNASSAIGWASLLLPFFTFLAITNFLIDHFAAAFFATVVTYSFTTAAMLVPAFYEFDIARGRTRVAGEE